MEKGCWFFTYFFKVENFEFVYFWYDPLSFLIWIMEVYLTPLQFTSHPNTLTFAKGPRHGILLVFPHKHGNPCLEMGSPYVRIPEKYTKIFKSQESSCQNTPIGRKKSTHAERQMNTTCLGLLVFFWLRNPFLGPTFTIQPLMMLRISKMATWSNLTCWLFIDF